MQIDSILPMLVYRCSNPESATIRRVLSTVGLYLAIWKPVFMFLIRLANRCWISACLHPPSGHPLAAETPAGMHRGLSSC